MKQKFFIFIVLMLGLGSCYDLDFVDNTKMKVYGVLKNENNQPLRNKLLYVRTQNLRDDIDSIYAPYENDATITQATTDANGNFIMYFPKTNGKEYLFIDEETNFKYIVDDVEVERNFYQIGYRDFQQYLPNLIVADL